MNTAIIAIIVIIFLISFLLKWFVFTPQPMQENQPSDISQPANVDSGISTTSGELVRHSNSALDRWIRSAPLFTFSEIVKRYYWAADAPVREFLRKKGWKSA